MRNHRSLITLAIVSAALAMPVCTVMAKTPKVTVDTAILQPAWSVFPGTSYDTTYSREFGTDDGYWPDAAGDIVVTQPTNLKGVTIDLLVEGLIPNTLFTVYFQPDGIVAGDLSTVGTNVAVGAFMTDGSGNGHYVYDAAAGTLAVGDYTTALFINGSVAPYRRTLLISENIQFSIR